MHADFASLIDYGYIDVAILDSHFVGYVVFYPEGDHFHLENVAILPEYGGLGIEKRLIDHVERSAEERGMKPWNFIRMKP